MTRWEYLSNSPDATRALGQSLAALLEDGMVVALSGDLGAGKTCFAQGVARGLGVPASIPVTSPTFALMNRYAGRLLLHHFDLYRLDDPEALMEMGLDEELGAHGVALVEWAEKGRLPVAALRVRFEAVGDGERRLLFEAGDECYARVLAALAGSVPVETA